MYKRQIDDIENIKEKEIYGSSKKGAYFSLNSFLETEKPYNGLFLNAGKVLLQNVFETLKIGLAEYKLQNVSTISDTISCKEYISEIDLDKMKYMYKCENVTVSKIVDFYENENVLAIKYEIKNDEENSVKFSIFPLVTYRDQLIMKKASFLKFGKRPVDNGIIVNLSIVDSKNLLIASKDAGFVSKDEYLSNIKHEVTGLELKKDVYIEDLYIPGEFELEVSPNETKTVKIYISDSIFDIDKIESITNEEESSNKDVSIDNEYVELKKLRSSLEFFEKTMLTSLPAVINKEYMMDLIDENNCQGYFSEMLQIIKSIDGKYICFNDLEKAVYDIKQKIYVFNKYDPIARDCISYYKCRFWLVEMINKVYKKDELAVDEMLKSYICSCISLVEYLLENQKYEIVKNLEIVSLMYNTIKIYEDILKDPRYEFLAEDIMGCIRRDFWNDDKRVLKLNQDDKEEVASADMLYCLSLSYSVLENDIKIKLLDTIFRQLYTPYGIRIKAKTDKETESFVYPKYMASFISANLNQNGSSYAAKKIAYNLVKDLFIDIDKYVKDNVKYVYSEKGIDIDFKVLDLYTTCEMIRLYTMFM